MRMTAIMAIIESIYFFYSVMRKDLKLDQFLIKAGIGVVLIVILMLFTPSIDSVGG